MAKSYFKDVYSYLTSLYPESKVYVVSDQHFDHKNIICYERNIFDSVDTMNEHIIESHNAVVSDDDIVIFLGDFSFDSKNIKEYTSRLNGHKFIILGNHDSEKLYIRKFHELGFEDVFLYPIKFEDKYLSHYPILGENPNNILYNLLKKEFQKKDGTNFHGHIHEITEPLPKSVNVSLENQDYKPVYIGKTGKSKKEYTTPLIISSDEFNEIITFLTQAKCINKETLIADFIYTMMIEATSAFDKDIFFSGSFALYKKFNYRDQFSDLDASIIYRPDRSLKYNAQLLKNCVDSAFIALNDFEGFNLSFHKRMQNIAIIDSLYTNKNGIRLQTYLDLNLAPNGIYIPEDFITFEDKTTIEKLCEIYYPDVLSKHYFPSFKALFLNTNGDLGNLILQYMYQLGEPAKKKKILAKINTILKNTPIDEINTDELEYTLIRFLLRNILFFRSANRLDEITAISNIDPNIMPFINKLPDEFINKLATIFNYPSSDYNLAYKEITKTPITDLETVSSEILTSIKK